MNETLFSETIHSEQFQVGQSNVKHITYGPCEIKEVETYQGRIYYKIKVIATNLTLKCISTKLSLMEVQEMVQIITPEKMNQIIDDPKNPNNEGKFMVITSDDTYVCCDNQTGDAWVEEFDNLITATKWLNGLIQMDDIYKDTEELAVKHP